MRSRRNRALLLIVASVFLLLRFLHLEADYPRTIRWDDGIATDEGWYASSAVNAQSWGVHYLPGDMNIPVLMPVWPVIAEIAFHTAGYSVTTLRATAILFFFADVGLLCALLRRFHASEYIPLFVIAIAVNPWAFVFSRSGFLEFPMLTFVLLAMLSTPADTGSDRGTDLLSTTVAGICFTLALLLKTTALALLPVLVYMLLQGARFQLVTAARRTALFLGVTTATYAAYALFYIKPHLADVHFYLSVVKNTLRYTPLALLADTSRPFRYGLGSDHLLFALAVLTVVLSLTSSAFRRLWRDPVFAVAAVWLIAFLGFMIKHNNDPARYFAVTLPAVFFIGLALLRQTHWTLPFLRKAMLALLLVDLTLNAAQTMAAVLHPTYTFRNAARAVSNTISADSDGTPVVIGDNAHEVALQSHMRPLNLLFHSASITQQVSTYRPQWWLQFAPIDSGQCFNQVLSRVYTAQLQGSWTIFYPGQQLILWKLQPIPGTSQPDTLTPAQVAACSPPVYN